jgi:nucleoside 2-deoxyribosyltransferase
MNESLTRCPICDHVNFEQHPIRSRDSYLFKCFRCGEYVISWEMLQMILVQTNSNDTVKAALSGLARELYETKQEYPTFLSTNFRQLATSYPVPDLNSIEDKAMKLVQRVKEKTTYFGEDIDLGDIEVAYPLAYAKNSIEFLALCEFLKGKGIASYTQHQSTNTKIVRVILTAEGWDLAKKQNDKYTDSQKGFVAIWFDDSMNESITAIEGAIQEAGFTPMCIRGEHFSERIMDKALGEIRTSRFVVVDLTGARSSVFFEAGFAHGLGIEAIYVFKEDETGENTPPEFYVKHYQCYKYKDADELQNVLTDAIRARMVAKK